MILELIVVIALFVVGLLLYRIWLRYDAYCTLQKNLAFERQKAADEPPDIRVEEAEDADADETDDAGFDPDA